MNHHGHNGPPPRDHQPFPHQGPHWDHHKGHHHRPPQAQHHLDPNAPPQKWHSYKMLVDPSIHKGVPKMMRYDGAIVPGNPHHVPPTVQDPRSKLPSALWRRMEAMDLPVPRFKIDENYVGEPPKVEVTVENMNDNIDDKFLTRMIEKFGVIEDMKIYYHPDSGKHLGLAHLCFEEVKAAKECVKYLHGKSVMGKQLNSYIDPLAKSCLKMYTDLTEEKKPEPLPPPPLPPPPPPNQPQIQPQQPLIETESQEFSPRDNVDWSHHHYPPPNLRRESREESRDPRRQSLDHDLHRRQSREYSREGSQDPNFHQDLDDKYQPTVFDPNYWQQEAQRYASQNQMMPLPNPPLIKDNNNAEDDKVKDENEEDDSDHKVDLDTRLKMLMKGKAGGAMPSFLMNELNGSEEEEENEVDEEIKQVIEKEIKPAAIPTFDPDPALSRAPSPFLSDLHYKTCHESWQASKLAEFNAKHNLKASPKSDDRMSLSSLSSGENNMILDQGNYANYGYYPPPPPGFDPMTAAHQSWYTQQYMQHYPHHQYYEQQQSHIQHEQKPWQDPYAAIKESLKSGKKSEKNIFRPIIKEAVRVVVQDLTQALTKDINKRMCETLGFYLFEKWWQEQETKYKEKHVPSTTTTTSIPKKKETTSSILGNQVKDEKPNLPRIPRVEDISSFFDKQRESMETTGNRSSGFGLGFRGTIPKLPSFKKKPGFEKSSKDEKKKKKSYSSDEADEKKKKLNEKRREQEKRREDRLSKDTKKPEKEKKKSESGTTISSIYKSLYSDTDESKDTELSDLDLKPASKTKEVPKAKVDKKLTKKRSSPPLTKTKKKKASSSTSEEEVSSSSSEDSMNTDEEMAKFNRAKEVAKKRAPVSKVKDFDESSQDSQSIKKGSSSASSGSSSVSSASESSASSSSESSEIEEKPKKPAPLRRASETLKTDSLSNKILEDSSDSHVGTPSHIAEDHCYARPQDIEAEKTSSSFENQFANDHGYTRPRTPPNKKLVEKPAAKSVLTPAAIFKKKNKISASVTPASEPIKRTFKERSAREEFDILYKFLTKGLDLEDIKYLKLAYNIMLDKQDVSKMLNYTHWVDHTITDIPEPAPPRKKRKTEDFSKPHLTGSARTEGYYKMDPREKARTKYHLQRGSGEANGIVSHEGAATKAKIQSAQSMSREARNMQRRQLAILGDEVSGSDLLKFNQLKFRRKNMTFGKSSIHDWGLFAREYIGADEMVIEYVGQVVRPVISDVREKRYEKQGIGSSYLFRIDLDYVVDATKCGNLARFINHSCDPNCYAKIITIDGQKKIVIYSKQPIAYGEEITYDYKFPIEDEKILCLCGSKNCRKYLN